MSSRVFIGIAVGIGIVALAIFAVVTRDKEVVQPPPQTSTTPASSPVPTPGPKATQTPTSTPVSSPATVPSPTLPTISDDSVGTGEGAVIPTPGVAATPVTTPIPTPTPTLTPVSTPTPDLTPSVSSEQEESPQASPTPTPKPRTHIVLMETERFNPGTITITKGDTIRWINRDTDLRWPASDPHPVHSNLPGFDSLGGLEVGEVYAYTFIESGTVTYHDHIDAQITGIVVVNE